MRFPRLIDWKSQNKYVNRKYLRKCGFALCRACEYRFRGPRGEGSASPEFLFYKMRKTETAIRRAWGRFLYNQQKNSKKSCEIWVKCIIMDAK